MAKWISQYVFNDIQGAQTLDCARSSRVDIWCQVQHNYDPVLHLINLEAGVPIWIWLQNGDSGSHLFQLTATTTAGQAYTISGVSGIGIPIAIGTSGMTLSNGYACVLIGSPIMQGSTAILSLAISAAASGGGTGDMTKAVYDTNANSIVDNAEALLGRVPPSSGDATSTQIVLGNDSRLSNVRTPSAHAPTHLSGGSDAISLVTTAAAGLCVPPDGSTIKITSGKLVASTPLTVQGVYDNVSTNQTLDCTGATLVSIWLRITTNATITLTLTNLTINTPVWINWYNNQAGTAPVLKIAASTPAPVSYKIWGVSRTFQPPIDFTTTGITVAGAQYLYVMNGNSQTVAGVPTLSLGIAM